MAFIFVLITGALIGALAGYLGSLMVTKRMGLVGGPLGHLALPGVAIALIFQFDIFFGGLISILLSVLLIWLLQTKTELPTEALIGIIFASGVALGFLFLPMSRAEEAIVGDIALIGLYDMLLVAISAILVFVIMEKIYNKLVLATISEELAKGKWQNLQKINFGYLLAIALITALEVKLMGILLTAALFVIPASAARNMSKNLKQYKSLSICLGALSALSGILLFKITLFPAGPLVILSASCFFLFSFLFKTKKT